MLNLRNALFGAAALALVACGGKSTTSNPIGLGINSDSGDVQSGILTQDRGIGSQAGDPYFDFISTAKQDFGGKTPTRLDVKGLTLTLGTASVGVATLDQVFAAGEVDVFFKIDSTNLTYQVGHVTNVTGVGPVDLSIDFKPDSLTSSEMTNLINGGAHVVIRGPATASFASSSNKADLELRFTFQAYE